MILRLKNKLVDILSTPIVMGVINLTDDSFYAKSRFRQKEALLLKVQDMIHQGVDIIDLGAASSRPGAVAPSKEQEKSRLLEALGVIRDTFPDVSISIDTYRSEVLASCLSYDIQLVNDISAGNLDPSFLALVGENKLPYVLMHMRGTPQTMQQNTAYEDIIWAICHFFIAKIAECKKYNIEDICIDPGFGFGKSLDDNFKLLSQMASFSFLGRPILAGLSRKSFIYNYLGINSDQALNGSTALHMLALYQGANILRVHDVREAKECILLWSKYKGILA